MNPAQLASTVDAVAFRDAEVGHGYADTQRPWAYRPAIDLPRATWQAWLGYVMARMRRPFVVHVTATPQPAMAESLQVVGAEVRTLGFQEAPAAICDVVLLDADDPVVLAELWARHAARVRAGGIVAIVDRSQDERGLLVDRGMGELLLRLEADLLVPHGQRWLRHGDASCIHSYLQTVATQMAPLPAIGTRSAADLPRPLGELAGFLLWSHADRCYAVPAAGPAFSLRNLQGNRFDVVLVAEHQAQLRQRVGAWVAVQAPLASAAACLANDPATAARLVATAVAAQPEVPAALIAAVEAAPWCKELLLACGLVQLFGTEPRAGGALLRRVAGIGLDPVLVACAGSAFVNVLRDEPGARALLESVREEVRLRQCAAVCRELPRGHVLWQYPDLLVAVRGVLEVGLHVGGHAATWQRLGVTELCAVDGDARGAAGQVGPMQRIDRSLASRSGMRPLWRETATGRTAWLRPLAGGVVETQVDAIPLDKLAAEGAIDPRRYNLLVVDAAGGELDILRGATAVLAHCDFLCITLWPEARHDGAPLPQDVQGYLRAVLGDEQGFLLAAYEPATDGVHGTALFRRHDLSGGPW